MSKSGLSVEERLAQLEAREQIRDVIARVARGVDRADEELIKTGYWPGAKDNHGAFQGSGEEFAHFISKVHAPSVPSMLHLIGQSAVVVTGGKARGETYFIAYLLRERDGITVLDYNGGRYVDEFERRGDEWRLSDRTVLMEWSDSKAMPELGTWDLTKFPPFTRDRTDPSYPLL